ncbi:MAG TPA: hypothetical protein VFW75_12495 [Acetobacteraceae bacterium]|nr:hypothetical protein [Acetobacteraceae bacterium]
MLIRDCALAIPDIAKTRYATGVGIALILTHECDIDENNERFFNDLVLVCPVISLDDFCEECEQEEGAGAWGGILSQIAGDNVYRAMYLPPLQHAAACPQMEGGGIIYLNHISPCRVAWISDPPGQAICSLSAPGLQALDFKLQNHFLREKAVPLWFSR